MFGVTGPKPHIRKCYLYPRLWTVVRGRGSPDGSDGDFQAVCATAYLMAIEQGWRPKRYR